MSRQSNYDYIIAGGGLSGLVLALKLQQSLPEVRVLIIDKMVKNVDDRTWSYWAKPDADLPNIACKSWSKFKINGSGGERELKFDPYRYFTVRGKDFYDYAKAQLTPDSRFTFLTDQILKIEAEKATVYTAQNGNFQASLIFKSYFSLKDISIGDDYKLLYQQFKGWIIETENPAFDPDILTLMDFRAKSPSPDIRFNYVLPFSPTQALIEYTAFTPTLIDEDTLDQHLRWYTEEILGLKKYKIHKTEFDAIPMTDYPFRPHQQGAVINIGTIAGFVKGSSGYCYTRTFEKIDALVKDLAAGKKTTTISTKSLALYRLFDSVLLNIMHKNQVSADLIFTNLYTKISPQTLFRFLDEKAKPHEILQVMMASPAKPQFIRTITRQLINISSL